jgi:hypothetical protein
MVWYVLLSSSLINAKWRGDGRDRSTELAAHYYCCPTTS